MIILEANQSLLFGGIPLTDWLQAIGALVAIVGVIWGWCQFRKDSKEKQSQIDSLTDLAKESALQTKEMIESNRIQINNLKKYEEHFEIIKSSNQREAEKRESDIQQSKLSIRPEFIFGSNREGLTSFYNGMPRPLETTLTIINRGEKAYIENVEFDNKSMKDDTTPLMNKMIMKDKGIQLKFSPIQPYDSYKECLIKFKLIYTDGEGNKYYQNIDGKFVGQPNISKPIEM